tara:strand:+ start:379 stop:603 length:225 start_codon:yes stop_codon:yes gene_type:complete
MKNYRWEKNIWTGSYHATVSESIQLIRLPDVSPPYFYKARERTGVFDAITGPVETSPDKAIRSLQKLINKRDRQ